MGGQRRAAAGSRRRAMDGLRAMDVLPLLRDRVALLTGARDPRGGPILTFPASARRDRTGHEDLIQLMQYMYQIPSDESRDLGFTVVIDMRNSTWEKIKPILKVLRDHFPRPCVHGLHPEAG
ncbi:Triple functional domain protein [Amphibalanus amphitrite]|uniref:Triple functional domain protein n=1 Tax=Amphibalanus amphitrite TaxID=1232801 RepID=A0A6A4W5J4_AMPAM|nr:Triple functional domain protein [Amphibalanus amphitrite]KAF0297162.1 Triple functional domain protein [Amphibalanus amphitrite]